MDDKQLRNYLKQSLGREGEPERMEETIKLCIEIMQKQEVSGEEPRLQFFGYLSEIFRFEGIPILGLQAITLFVVFLAIRFAFNIPNYIPVFMPLFALAVIPVIFRSQYYGMSEIEAATRTSGAQIMLAKLILAGAANLVGITVILCLEVSLQNSCDEIGQMILYCLVPYLVSMVVMLRVIRLRKKDGIPICIAAILSSCVCWSLSARVLPWLYEASAMGVWIAAFLLFTVFFVKEIYFIVKMRKEGKMYGTIA